MSFSQLRWLVSAHLLHGAEVHFLHVKSTTLCSFLFWSLFGKHDEEVVCWPNLPQSPQKLVSGIPVGVAPVYDLDILSPIDFTNVLHSETNRISLTHSIEAASDRIACP
jgi:hypothetical protein